MKFKTKLKILHWVEKLIKWNPVDGMRLIITQEKRTIQIARVSHIIPQKEINMIGEDQIKFSLNLPLIDELMTNNAIEYTEEVDLQTGDVKKTATLKFIMP